MKSPCVQALTLGALALTALPACAVPQAEGEDVERTADALSLCGQWDTYSADSGEYTIQQDEWGGNFGQCINASGTGFTVTSGTFNASTSGAPDTYPSIYKGCHWGDCTTSSGLPVEVSKIGSALSSWSTTLVSGSYDVAYDIWFNQTPTTSGQPNGAELMIWINRGGSPQPAGSKVGNVTVAGSNWDVWLYHDPTWTYVAYFQTTGTSSVTNLDIKAITNDAVGRGYIQPSWYLIDVEAGFEIWNGGTGLTTNSFSFDVTAAGSSSSSSSSSSTTSSSSSSSSSSGTSSSSSSSSTASSSSTSGSTSSSGGSGAPCTGAVTVTGGQSGNFNTTGAVCYRTADTIHGWGCSNQTGRSVSVDGTSVSCGALPLPAKESDGYSYFSFTAGAYPYASFYWW